MIRSKLLVMACGCVVLAGCTSHLLFVEEENIGLKVAFQPDNPSPTQVTIGARRGVVAIVPQKALKEVPTTNAVNFATAWEKGSNGQPTNVVVTIFHDPNELMSLYTVFKANIGIFAPIYVDHLLVTGSAAVEVMANSSSLSNLNARLSNR